MVTDIERKIEEKQLSLKDVDRLLIEISWLKYPEMIRKLLEYKKLPADCLAPIMKTDAEIKAEWKTEKLPDGTLKLANYKGTDTVVVIPVKIGKVIVSEIGDYALSVKKTPLKRDLKENRAKIKEVRIPNTIKSIGESAFEACENLEKVTWTSSPVTISKNAFKDCAKLAYIDLHESTKILGEGAFRGCQSLEQVIVPEGVQLSRGLFSECSKVKKIVLPGGVKTLPDNIFNRCTNLVDVNLPDGLSDIEWAAFYECKNLPSLVIPDTVESIAENHYGSFYGCKKLVLLVKAGSYGEQYAKTNNIPYAIA